MVTTRSGKIVADAKDSRSSVKALPNDIETDSTSSDTEVVDAPIVYTLSSSDSEASDKEDDDPVSETLPPGDVEDDAPAEISSKQLSSNEQLLNEKDVSVVDKLASSDIEDDVPVTDILTSSEDDAPAEISSKLPSQPLKKDGNEEQSGFEKIQLGLVEKEVKKQEMSRRLKRKKMKSGALNIKLKKSEFNVVALDGKYKSPIEPEKNFKADLLLSRTAHLRFKNGSKQFSQRSKWAQTQSGLKLDLF